MKMFFSLRAFICCWFIHAYSGGRCCHLAFATVTAPTDPFQRSSPDLWVRVVPIRAPTRDLLQTSLWACPAGLPPLQRHWTTKTSKTNQSKWVQVTLTVLYYLAGVVYKTITVCYSALSCRTRCRLSPTSTTGKAHGSSKHQHDLRGEAAV